MQNNLFRLDTKTGTRTPLGSAEGVHSGQLSPSGRYLIDQYNSPTVPRSINIIDVQSGKSVNLLTAADPFTGYKMPGIETGTIKAADGKTDLYYRLIKPADFDPNKKYPTLLFCEGGPQSPVSQFWSYRWNFQIMAANDYIIVAPNRRGLPGFGMEWNEQISGDYGGQCMKDYFTAIDEMAKEPYVDTIVWVVSEPASAVSPFTG